MRRGRATRFFLVALAVVGVVSTIALIAQARLLAVAITSVFATHELTGLPTWLALLAGVFAVRGVLAWANQWLAHRASAAVKAGLREDLLRARLARPLDQRTSSSTLVGLVTTGLDALDGYYQKYLPQLVLAVVVPLLILGVIAREDVLSAVVIAVTLPLIPVFMALIGWTTQAQVARRWKVQDRLANRFADLVTGLPTLQVFGRARGQRTGLAITEEANRRETMKTLRVSFLSSFALELLATLSVALVAVSVGFRVVYGNMGLDEALFILVLAPEAYLPMRQVGTHFHDAADGMAAADQALTIIEAAEKGPAPSTAPAAGLSLDLQEVAFSHGSTPVLDDLSLRVARGEVVALTGASGGGKSTALALAMGFLDPAAGTVAVDRTRVAWVGQEPGLLRGAVARSLRMGDPDADEATLRSALDDAGAPGIGLDHEVGDDAQGLSAGERRRVAIARALLRIRSGAADLLVMDEPTAGLDSDTEATVLQAVRASGASALVVSHRPAVLAAADRVITLDPDPRPATNGPPACRGLAAATPTQKTDPLATPNGPGAGGGLAPATRAQEPATSPELGPIALVRGLLRTTPGARGRFAFTILLAALASGASVALMAVSGWLLSRAAEHPPVLYLEAAAVAVRFFGISRGVARYAERIVGHDLSLRLQGALRLRSYDALSRTTLLGRRRGDLLIRLVADVDAVQDAIVRVAVPMLSSALVVLFTCTGLVLFDPASAAVLFTSALVASVLLPWLAQATSRRADTSIVPARGELADRADELSQAAADVVAFGATDDQLAEVLAVHRRLERAERRSAWVRGLATGGQVLAAGAAVIGALWFGAHAVHDGRMRGRALAVVVLTPLALHEVFGTFALAGQTWTRSRTALARVAQMLAAPAVGRGDRPEAPAAAEPSITLRDLSAGWPGQPPVVEHLDLTVRAGERVALVGPSGIGKTTVLATVMGLIDPVAGEVTTSGQVGYLAQDAHLFATSIAENVRIGNRDATDDQVRDALRAAGVDLDPSRLVSWHGGSLSGGEARRVALARVLVASTTQALLLDEPTEHLDAETAEALVDDLWRATVTRATILVTHDSRLIQRCDRVVELPRHVGADSMPLPDRGQRRA